MKGKLTVASKEEVTELVSAIVPILMKAGRRLQGPLGRCWRAPCCSNPEHHTNYQDSGYLWELANSTNMIREYLRDFAFMKRKRRFRLMCPNCLIGMGERNDNPEMEDLCAVAERWGAGPVHPGTGHIRTHGGRTDGGAGKASQCPTLTVEQKRMTKPEKSSTLICWSTGSHGQLAAQQHSPETHAPGRRPQQAPWRGVA
jgi:hypothetical protein